LSKFSILNPIISQIRYFKKGCQWAETNILYFIRFHAIRPIGATLMFKEGIHPKVVQEILGLASITQTLDTYGNMIPSKQHEVAALMDELMSPK
jgi:integrase